MKTDAVKPTKDNEPSRVQVHEPRFKETEGIVECGGMDMHSLWQQYAEDSPFKYDTPQPRYKWQQDNPGRMFEVGTFGGWPICVQVHWNIVGERRLLFWEVASQVAHYQFTHHWIETVCPKGIPHENAMNFHNVVHGIEYGGRAKMKHTTDLGWRAIRKS